MKLNVPKKKGLTMCLNYMVKRVLPYICGLKLFACFVCQSHKDLSRLTCKEKKIYN